VGTIETVPLLDEPEQLVVAAGLREGRREAWARLYDAYSLDVWRYVARLMGPEAAAVADAVQETFLEAARSAARFDPDRGTLWTWLTGIAHHRAAAHWRQAGRIARLRKLVESRAAEIRHLLDAAESNADSPLETWEQHELAELVRSALADLPADYAAILTAKYLDDRSLAELSTQTGSSIEAVKSKLARARREFRAKFERLTREPSHLT
jgi:RNA polymerase sigma-70 factor, ECF subfamily